MLKSNTSSFDSQVSRLKIKTDIQQLQIAAQQGAGLSPWEASATLDAFFKSMVSNGLSSKMPGVPGRPLTPRSRKTTTVSSSRPSAERSRGSTMKRARCAASVKACVPPSGNRPTRPSCRPFWASYIGNDVQTKNPFPHVRFHDVYDFVYDFPLF